MFATDGTGGHLRDGAGGEPACPARRWRKSPVSAAAAVPTSAGCNAVAARSPSAPVAKSVVAAAAAVPNVGLPDRSLYAPVVATVARSSGCVAELAFAPCVRPWRSGGV